MFCMIDIKNLNKYTNTKKSSILFPYIEHIKYLLDNNASQVAIIRYLDEEENIKITRPALSKFIKKHIKKEPYTPPTKEKKSKLRSSIFDDD